MKEYTLLALISVFITFILNSLSGVRVFNKKEYYVYLAVIFGFFLLMNGHLTAKPIVLYNPRFFLGIRIGTIPLEDFLFNFSMITLTIIFWEFFKRKKERG